MNCRPLVIHRDGAWQAWCKPCAWESATFAAASWARAAAEQHKQQEQRE